MWDKQIFFVVVEKTVIFIKTHKNESSIHIFLNRLIIYYIIKVLL